MDDHSDHFPIFCVSELNVKKHSRMNNERLMTFYRKNTNDNIKGFMISLHCKISKQVTMHVMQMNRIAILFKYF